MTIRHRNGIFRCVRHTLRAAYGTDQLLLKKVKPVTVFRTVRQAGPHGATPARTLYDVADVKVKLYICFLQHGPALRFMTDSIVLYFG